jgi:Zn-dependent protease
MTMRFTRDAVRRAAVQALGRKRPNHEPVNDPDKTGWAERPENKQYDVREGEYLPPGQGEEQQKEGRTAKGLGAAAVGVGVLLAKFKGLLLLLLNLKWAIVLVKVFTYGGSFLISLFFYAMFWGWKFALVFLLMILAHEFGHYVTIRNYGLPARLPMFVPFFGAYTVGGVPASLEHDAYIALAGPLTGLGVSAACYFYGFETHEIFWYMAAYVGAFVNLFNMIPAMPFDGGRVAGAISPALWVIGFVLFVGLSFALHVPFFFIIIFGLLALPSAIAGFRGYVDPRYATMTAGGKIRVGLWYLATLFALFYLMSISHVVVPQQT